MIKLLVILIIVIMIFIPIEFDGLTNSWNETENPRIFLENSRN